MIIWKFKFTRVFYFYFVLNIFRISIFWQQITANLSYGLDILAIYTTLLYLHTVALYYSMTLEWAAYDVSSICRRILIYNVVVS